jgi:HSP20 family protein
MNEEKPKEKIDKEKIEEKSFLDKVFEETSKTMERARSEIEKSIQEYTAGTGKEVTETFNSILITVKLPGVKKEDIKVNITDNKVHIRAVFDEKQLTGESDEMTPEDIKLGEIIRVFKLPKKVIPEKAQAEFKNNVMKIEIPKASPEKSLELKIE